MYVSRLSPDHINRAARLQQCFPVEDLHSFTLLQTKRDLLQSVIDLLTDRTMQQPDLPRPLAGKIGIQFFAVNSNVKNSSLTLNLMHACLKSSETNLVSVCAVCLVAIRSAMKLSDPWTSETTRDLHGGIIVLSQKAWHLTQTHKVVTAILAVKGLTLIESDTTNVDKLYKNSIYIPYFSSCKQVTSFFRYSLPLIGPRKLTLRVVMTMPPRYPATVLTRFHDIEVSFQTKDLFEEDVIPYDISIFHALRF